MLDGVLILNKEKGFTSMDAIAVLRGITKQKRIGHGGTLDPMAEGVLPILFGAATKLSDPLMAHEKEYKAGALFGLTTDTQDITGNVLSRKEDCFPESGPLEKLFEEFMPGYDQLPPMYSARKVKGKKLYDLARRGEVIERKTKWADIPEIRLLSLKKNRAELYVRCGKGTYIRTLIHDIGERLGTGACMDSLVRTRVGSFLLTDALTIREFETLFQAGKAEEALIPVDRIKALLERN